MFPKTLQVTLVTAIFVFIFPAKVLADALFSLEVKEILVSDVEPSLPKVTFEVWLREMLDDKFNIHWKGGQCGRFQGVELRASGIAERMCLLASRGSISPKEIELIFGKRENCPNLHEWCVRRIRLYPGSSAYGYQWIEFQKLSHLASRLSAD